MPNFLYDTTNQRTCPISTFAQDQQTVTVTLVNRADYDLVCTGFPRAGYVVYENLRYNIRIPGVGLVQQMARFAKSTTEKDVDNNE